MLYQVRDNASTCVATTVCHFSVSSNLRSKVLLEKPEDVKEFAAGNVRLSRCGTRSDQVHYVMGTLCVCGGLWVGGWVGEWV